MMSDEKTFGITVGWAESELSDNPLADFCSKCVLIYLLQKDSTRGQV